MTFIPGLKLCEQFFHEAVKPVLDAAFPQMTAYAAALIGSGPEVLGFDTPMSSDHHWGPRVMLFLSPADYAQNKDAIHRLLADKLPYTFQGYPTHFTPPNEEDNGTQLLETITAGPVNHRVEIYTVQGFFEDYLGIDPFADLTPAEWLMLPAQKLRSCIAGAVYYDDSGELTRIRDRLHYYPQDVWLYLLMAAWNRVGQEEHFLGRTGYVDDELGSRLIGARLVHDLMNLCFLMQKQYAPYSKWFGTAFRQLQAARVLTPIFHEVLSASTWQLREKHLIQAYAIVADWHNRLGITEPLPTDVSPFHDRPFMVIHGDVFANAIQQQIHDPQVQRIATVAPIGNVDLISTNTELLSYTHITSKIRVLWE